MGLGVIERYKGKHQLAKEMYEKALKINPRNAEAYSSLLMLEIFNKNYSNAVILGEKAVSLMIIKDNPGILGNLVIAYHMNNQLLKRNSALADLEKTNYRNIDQIKKMISDEIDINEVFSQKLIRKE